MSRWRDWSLGQKLITFSVVGFLLCVPLCGYGLTLEHSGTPAQQLAGNAGVLLLYGSVAMFVVGLLMVIVGKKP